MNDTTVISLSVLAGLAIAGAVVLISYGLDTAAALALIGISNLIIGGILGITTPKIGRPGNVPPGRP